METTVPKARAGDKPLLTVGDVRALKADYEADMQLFADLPARIEQKKRKLDAALMFLPTGANIDDDEEEQADQLSTPVPADSDASVPKWPMPAHLSTNSNRTSWASAMAAVLAALPGGSSHKDLRSMMEKSALAKGGTLTTKTFYNTISRLAEKGDLIKSGGLLFHKEVFARVMVVGPAAAPSTAPVQLSSSAKIVAEALAPHPKGLSVPEIRQVVSTRPDAPKSLRNHSQYVYSILATMTKHGVVRKQKENYYLVKKGGI